MLMSEKYIPVATTNIDRFFSLAFQYHQVVLFGL